MYMIKKYTFILIFEWHYTVLKINIHIKSIIKKHYIIKKELHFLVLKEVSGILTEELWSDIKIVSSFSLF